MELFKTFLATPLYWNIKSFLGYRKMRWPTANLPHLKLAIYPNVPTTSQHTKDSLPSHSMWRYSNKASWSSAINYFSHWHDPADLQTLATLTDTTRGFALNPSQAPCTTLVVHVAERLPVELVWATTPFFGALSIKSTNRFFLSITSQRESKIILV